MTTIMKNLNLNQKLAAVVGTLGFFAVFAGDPYVGSRAVIDSDELAMIVHKEVDHVSAMEMADWIIRGKTDYRLLDLRDEPSFALYHIPTAELVPVTGVDDYPIARNEKIVLYSEGGIHSAQAWFLLKARKFPAVYILRGGLEEWKESVLFPTIAPNASSEELSEFEKAKSVAAFFGGKAQVGGSDGSSPEIAMPKIDMPAPSTVPGGTAKKKKKEGC